MEWKFAPWTQETPSRKNTKIEFLMLSRIYNLKLYVEPVWLFQPQNVDSLGKIFSVSPLCSIFLRCIIISKTFACKSYFACCKNHLHFKYFLPLKGCCFWVWWNCFSLFCNYLEYSYFLVVNFLKILFHRSMLLFVEI